jgi:hypothetical protein
MNIAAAVSAGGFGDRIVIGGGFRLGVMEMKFEPALISSPVFRFPRYAARNHTICQKEKLLEFSVGHFFPHATAMIQPLQRLSAKPDEIFIRRPLNARFFYGFFSVLR